MSDIHGNLPALEACRDELTSLGVDITVCLGDLVQYGPYPAEVMDFVIEHDMQCIQGDCDRAVSRGGGDPGDEFENVYWKELAAESMKWTVERLDKEKMRFLRKLPADRRYLVGRREILCVHGLPGNVRGGAREEYSNEVYEFMLRRNGCDVLLLGHTHRLFLRSLDSGMIVNPGSVGGGTLPRESTVSVLEADEENGVVSVAWHRVPYDFEAYAEKYRKAGLPEIFLRCMELGRDPRGPWLGGDIARRQSWPNIFRS